MALGVISQFMKNSFQKFVNFCLHDKNGIYLVRKCLIFSAHGVH